MIFKNKVADLRNQKGFTLIELVLVIAVLGLLAVAAFPQFFDVNLTNARQSSRDGVVGAIQAGLSLYAAQQVSNGSAESYPTLLETSDLADGTAATRTQPLFNNVMQGGVTAQWFKVDDDCYAYDTNGNSTLDDGTDVEYQFSNTAGTYLGVADCGP